MMEKKRKRRAQIGRKKERCWRRKTTRWAERHEAGHRGLFASSAEGKVSRFKGQVEEKGKARFRGIGGIHKTERKQEAKSHFWRPKKKIAIPSLLGSVQLEGKERGLAIGGKDRGSEKTGRPCQIRGSGPAPAGEKKGESTSMAGMRKKERIGGREIEGTQNYHFGKGKRGGNKFSEGEEWSVLQ